MFKNASKLLAFGAEGMTGCNLMEWNASHLQKGHMARLHLRRFPPVKSGINIITKKKKNLKPKTDYDCMTLNFDTSARKVYIIPYF